MMIAFSRVDMAQILSYVQEYPFYWERQSATNPFLALRQTVRVPML